MKRRTRSRELALQFLYQLDLLGDSMRKEADAFVHAEEGDHEAARFALALIDGVHSRKAEIDGVIQSVAQNWNISRMAVVDRNVLRLATWELLYCDEVPPKVAVNEAIELGKRFSTQNSGAFVNGILDKIMNSRRGLSARGDEAAAAATLDEELPADGDGAQGGEGAFSSEDL